MEKPKPLPVPLLVLMSEQTDVAKQNAPLFYSLIGHDLGILLALTAKDRTGIEETIKILAAVMERVAAEWRDRFEAKQREDDAYRAAVAEVAEAALARAAKPD